MGTYIEKGCLTYKDKNGDLHELYPATYKECVYGMEELDAHLVDYENPHKLKPATIGAAESDHTHDEFEEIGKSIDDMQESTSEEFEKVNADINDLKEACNLIAETVSNSRAYAQNLLDNSDFSNPVNQRGLSEYYNIMPGELYYGASIDRWEPNVSDIKVTVNSNGRYVSLLPKESAVVDRVIALTQRVPKERVRFGSQYTAAIGFPDGSIETATFILSGQAPDGQSFVTCCDGSHIRVDYYPAVSQTVFEIMAETGVELDISWVAMYEGEYVKDTLPAYQSKGYFAELEECRRYYTKVDIDGVFTLVSSVATSDTTAIGVAYLLKEMYNDGLGDAAGKPRVELKTGSASLFDGITEHEVTNLEITCFIANIYNITITSSDLTPGNVYMLRLNDAILEFRTLRYD